MSLKIAGLIVAMFLLGGAIGVAQAHGLSPAKLVNAGWGCFNVPGLGVHCSPPGTGASDATITISVFDTDNPEATHADFLGTEMLIREDLYHGQPCPQDGGGPYHFLPAEETPFEVSYYACHHYDTGGDE